MDTDHDPSEGRRHPEEGHRWEHRHCAECWCRPELFYTTEAGVQVWVHHDPRLPDPPPANVLAAAIALAYEPDDDDTPSGDVHTIITFQAEEPPPPRRAVEMVALLITFAGLVYFLGRRQR